jgi:paraquat-inducible protein B
MSKATGEAASATPLARVRVKANARTYPVVWVVPLAAALVAGYLVYERVQDVGPTITIKFKDGSGLRTGQTPIKYRGVSIGEVVAMDLSNDRRYVLASVRLRRADAAMADEGAKFWIVRPEVGLGNITGLSTVMTGPEIQMLPGTGVPRSEFVGLETAPAEFDQKGLEITLHSIRLGSIRPHSPIFYRGIEVGTVQNTRLSADATSADIQAFLPQRYAHLVRDGSKFWKISGAEISGGLIQGMEFKLESLRSLVAGGFEFAMREDAGNAPAKKKTKA